MNCWLISSKTSYSAETRLVKALPKMAKAASDETLREAIESHLEETKGHVERLNRIAKTLGSTLSGKRMSGMEGLLEEGKEVLDADGPGPILDLAMIAAAQRVEHYEISAYGTARTLAEELGRDDAARLLQETLDEESAADEKLTGIATDTILPSASNGEEEEDEDEEEEAPKSNGGRGNKHGKQKSSR